MRISSSLTIDAFLGAEQIATLRPLCLPITPTCLNEATIQPSIPVEQIAKSPGLNECSVAMLRDNASMP
jgi:hypothetical protein